MKRTMLLCSSQSLFSDSRFFCLRMFSDCATFWRIDGDLRTCADEEEEEENRGGDEDEKEDDLLRPFFDLFPDL